MTMKRSVIFRNFLDGKLVREWTATQVVYTYADGTEKVFYAGCRRPLTSTDPYIYEHHSRTLEPDLDILAILKGGRPDDR